MAERGEIYTREYGLRPVVNCIGTMTSLGGSALHPDAVAAMEQSSKTFVDLNALLRSAGKRVAELVSAPSGYDAHLVTGAAAGIAYCTAACLTASPSGIDAAAVAALPDTSRLSRRDVVVDGGSDMRWYRAAALTGARVRPLGEEGRPMTADELQAELRRGTACCVLYFSCGDEDGRNGKVPLSRVIEMAHAHGVPVVVDAAARVPPRSNFTVFPRMGADAVLFSGGKAIRGPQTSGIIVGRQWLIDAARANGSPNEPTVCRSMKCAKEDICGLVAALRAFVSKSDEDEEREWEGTVERLSAALRSAPGIRGTRRVCPGPPDVQPNHVPLLYIDLDAEAGQRKGGFLGDAVDHGNPLAVRPTGPPSDLASRLVSGTPCIAVNLHSDGIVVNPFTLQREDEVVVADRIRAAAAAMVSEGVLRRRAAL
eukprot:TRINITY_DN26457_c0_g1_i1.p1 TRINITY_DN26457_c0_g1~~TRINITY_DN26457_c0_g1_i1.p1  ORF type:complete len:426 (+),score=143.74 TRINITY_DN26457_c0_g1_i1:63-1340(+)